jgi:hypothetical protein
MSETEKYYSTFEFYCMKAKFPHFEFDSPNCKLLFSVSCQMLD